MRLKKTKDFRILQETRAVTNVRLVQNGLDTFRHESSIPIISTFCCHLLSPHSPFSFCYLIPN